MKNKKILIVTHQFLPHVSPRTTRWSLLIDELINKGNDVTVLSGTDSEGIEKNYKILYFGNKQFSSNVNKIRQNSQDSSNNSIKKISYSILKKIYRFLFKTFSWPDYAMFWAFTIFKNRKRIENKFDIIISVSLPFTSHLCAYILQKRISADWYMDIGDPFSLKINSPENNKIIYSYLNKYYEKKFYQNAKKIIFTHSEVAELHQDKFNIDRRLTSYSAMVRANLISKSEAKKILINKPISEKDEINLQEYILDKLDISKEEFFIKDRNSPWQGKSLFELYEQAYTPWDWHKPIMDYAKKLNLLCFSSPFDDKAVDFLEDLNIPAYKIASFENSHLPLIKKVLSETVAGFDLNS